MKPTVARRLWTALDYMLPLSAAQDRLYVPRTDNVATDFRRQLRFPGHHKLLVMGAVGSGKSTEIYRLMALHAGSSSAPVVGVVNLAAHFQVTRLEPVQVLVMLGLATTRLVGPEHEPPPDLMKALGRAYTAIQAGTADPDMRGALSRLAKKVLVLVLHGAAAVGLGPGIVPDAAIEAGAGLATHLAPERLSVPTTVRDLSENDHRVTELVAAVNALVRWTRRELGDRRTTLFVDGLDKILDPERAREMFSCGILNQYQGSLVLAAPLVLRIGPSTTFGANDFRPLYLGNFRIFRRDAGGEHDEDAFAAMRGIFARRVREEGYEPAQVIEGGDSAGGLLDRLVEASGGVVRDFVLLCRIAVEYSFEDSDEEAGSGEIGAPIGGDEVSAAIHEVRGRYLEALDADRVRVLGETLSTTVRQGGKTADELLLSNHVLCYGNGAPWHRPHPLVIPYVQESRAKLSDGS